MLRIGSSLPSRLPTIVPTECFSPVAAAALDRPAPLAMPLVVEIVLELPDPWPFRISSLLEWYAAVFQLVET